MKSLIDYRIGEKMKQTWFNAILEQWLVSSDEPEAEKRRHGKIITPPAWTPKYLLGLCESVPQSAEKSW